MDAEKLIEEAGRWAEHVRQSPGNGTAGEDRYLAGLLDKLAAALKASEERARKAEDGFTGRGETCRRIAAALLFGAVGEPNDSDLLACAERVVAERDHERRKRENCMQIAYTREHERDALAAANLAANKRIVELEQERDAARAELARLTTPRPIAEAPRDGSPVLCEVPGYGRRHLFWNEAWYLVGAPEYTYAPVSFYPSLWRPGGTAYRRLLWLRAVPGAGQRRHPHCDGSGVLPARGK